MTITSSLSSGSEPSKNAKTFSASNSDRSWSMDNPKGDSNWTAFDDFPVAHLDRYVSNDPTLLPDNHASTLDAGTNRVGRLVPSPSFSRFSVVDFRSIQRFMRLDRIPKASSSITTTTALAPMSTASSLFWPKDSPHTVSVPSSDNRALPSASVGSPSKKSTTPPPLYFL